MVIRNNFAKAAFVSGALTVGLLAGSLPAIAQVFDAEQVSEMTPEGMTSDLSAVSESAGLVQSGAVQSDWEQAESETGDLIDEASGDVQSESEAAMLEIARALDADGVEEVALPIAVIQDEPVEAMAAVRLPGASALDGLEGASLETASGPMIERDLVASSFAVSAEDVPALTAALQSDSALTQLYAADTLWTLTGDRDLILPTLMEAAVNGDVQAQDMAIRAIAQMGEQALPAVPLLNRLAGSSRTRSLARNALTVVRSGNPSAAALGIIARESRRRIIPAALRAITGLWR